MYVLESGPVRPVPTPLYSAEEILGACADLGPSAPWSDFIYCFNEEILRTVHRQARRCGNNRTDVVDDLIQKIYLRLSDPKYRVLAKFKAAGPGSAHAYIHVVTKNFVTDFFKSRFAKKHGGKIIFLAPEDTDVAMPEGRRGTASAMDLEVLLAQIDMYLHMLDKGPTWDRDYKIFWSYYKEGKSAREIAMEAGIGLTAEGVESVLLRMVREVRKFLVEGWLNPTGAAG